MPHPSVTSSDEDVAAGRGIAPARAGATSLANGEMTVLVVEDNPGDQRLAEIALKEGGEAADTRCTAISADSLRSALAEIENSARAFDAFLLDLNLPDATGFDGIFELGRIAPNVPIIVLTGLADMATATEALKHGASDYLDKGDMQATSLWRAIRYSIERKKSEAELTLLANTDPLTGVLNRRALFRHLATTIQQARRTGLRCAFIEFDIDGLKGVNDLYGHRAGDSVLIGIAALVRDSLQPTETIGRLGGDEFAVVARNIATETGAMELAERIRRTIESMQSAGGPELSPTASVGVSVYPDDDSPAEQLMMHADMAMYRAKRHGKSSIVCYDRELDLEYKSRHVMKKGMLGEAPGGEFYLDYQPIIDSTSLRIVGAEALARWRNPDGEIVPPGHFIPIAEEEGWIAELGVRLVRHACREIKNATDSGRPFVPISINVSASQCKDCRFGPKLVRTIAEFGLNPKYINIEMTESTVMRDSATVLENLKLLKDAGLRIHIDDFGTGYSSLSVLKDLPLDVLKIDRSFVSELESGGKSVEIVETIVHLAKTLGFRTVAEGVETIEQAQLLRDIGVDRLQGYYFCRPVGLDILQQLLLASTPIKAGDGLEFESLPLAQSA